MMRRIATTAAGRCLVLAVGLSLAACAQPERKEVVDQVTTDELVDSNELPRPVGSEVAPLRPERVEGGVSGGIPDGGIELVSDGAVPLLLDGGAAAP